MSRYKTLLVTEENGFIAPQTVQNLVTRSEATTFVSPANPLAKAIPFNPQSPAKNESSIVQGSFTVQNGNPGSARANGEYGPPSSRYASLRYYGNGVY